MEAKKVFKITFLLIVLSGAGYAGYRFYRNWKTSSGDPQKNSRKILVQNNNV